MLCHLRRNLSFLLRSLETVRCVYVVMSSVVARIVLQSDTRLRTMPCTVECEQQMARIEKKQQQQQIFTCAKETSWSFQFNRRSHSQAEFPQKEQNESHSVFSDLIWLSVLLGEKKKCQRSLRSPRQRPLWREVEAVCARDDRRRDAIGLFLHGWDSLSTGPN